MRFPGLCLEKRMRVTLLAILAIAMFVSALSYAKDAISIASATASAHHARIAEMADL